MKKLIFICALVVAMIFTGCNNSHSGDIGECNSTSNSTESATEKNIEISSNEKSYELIFWFDSQDIFKSFLMGDDREKILEDSYIDLSEEDAKKLCKVADKLYKETVYTVSFKNQPGSVCIWVPDSSIITDYLYKYNFEKFHIEFHIMKPNYKEWFKEKGIFNYLQFCYDDYNYTIVEGGFVTDEGYSFLLTKITVEGNEIDAVYETGARACLYFELEGQFCCMYFRYKHSLDEVLEIAENLEIKKLNLDESLTQ